MLFLDESLVGFRVVEVPYLSDDSIRSMSRGAVAAVAHICEGYDIGKAFLSHTIHSSNLT